MADLRTPLRASRPPSPYRRSRGPFLALLVLSAVGVAAVVFLVAKAGEDSQPALSISPTPPPTVEPTTTLDTEAATKAEIIAAYRQSRDAFVEIASDPAGQVDDPRLAKYKKGTALAAAQLSIRRWRADGDVMRVTQLELNPRVVELGPNTAVVEDCTIDVSALVDQSTGEVIIPAEPPQPDLVIATYEFSEGVWMQDGFKDPKDPCSAVDS